MSEQPEGDGLPDAPAGADYFAWQSRGLCVGLSAELFFPEEEPHKLIRRQREEQAKKICRACPVLQICREHALRTPERFGVWGALTTRERLGIAARAS